MRGSRISTILGVVLLLVIVVVVLGTTTHLFDPITQRFLKSAATPQPTITPGNDLFFINTASLWGRVSIDGVVLKHLPQLENNNKPLRLSIGLHRIVWHADPFKPIICTVSVPSLLAEEPCKLELPVKLQSGETVREVLFSASLDSLPPDQQMALLQQAQQAVATLQSTETVQPGELYAYLPSSQQVASPTTATQTLLATLSFHLDTNLTTTNTCPALNQVDTCTYNGLSCLHFCTLPPFVFQPIGATTSPTSTPTSSTSSTEEWSTLGLAYATWDYKTPGGKIIAQNQPNTDSLVVDPDHNVLLHILWDGQTWHVTVNTSRKPICAPMTEEVFNDGSLNSLGTASNDNPHWDFAEGKNLATGCLGIVTLNQDYTPTAHQPVAYFLHHFGVILAANALAHRYYPFLPMADAYEQSSAQQIETTHH